MSAYGKLGKRAPVYHPSTLKLARYLDVELALPAVPASTNRAAGVNMSWGMMRNDAVGDCTCAGAGHAIQFWTAGAVTVPDDAVLSAYEAVTAAENSGNGYNPVNGANDNGCAEIDVLNYWRDTGVGGHKIQAYAAVNLQSPDLVRAACYLFDGLYIGLALPASAQGQQVWDYDPSTGSQAYPGSWGGHCVFVTDYDATGLTLITWGALKRMTWPFWATYCDEAYAIISVDEFISGGKTAEGFDAPALVADLAQIG